jgi:ATP-dependent Lon protease
VGGIKAKLLAAHRAGIRRVLLPEDNAVDLEELPTDIRQELEIHLVKDMAEVLGEALLEASVSTEPPVVPPNRTGSGEPASHELLI